MCPHVSAWLLLDTFLSNLILEKFVKTCQENPNVLKIGLKYQVTLRPKYIYIDGSSTKFFAASQQ